MSTIKLSFAFDVERPRGEFAKTETLSRQLDFVSGLMETLDSEGVPRTFFFLGQYLEGFSQLSEPASRICKPGNGLNEVGSHGYSHRAFRNIETRPNKTPITPEEFVRGLEKTNRLLKDILGVTPRGLRTPFGYSQDLSDMPEMLEGLERLGFCYVSSDLCGPLEAPLTRRRQPHTYGHVGYPDIVEIPVHGWHDTVLSGEKCKKYFNAQPGPDEIVGHYTGLFDTAEKMGRQDPIYMVYCLHPWALMEYDPRLEIQKGIIGHARERGIEFVSCGAIADEVLSQVPV